VGVAVASGRDNVAAALQGAEQLSRGPGLMATSDIHQASCALGVTRRAGGDAEIAAQGSVFLSDLFGDKSFGRGAGVACMVNKRRCKRCK
jgi:hypothetical protein